MHRLCAFAGGAFGLTRRGGQIRTIRVPRDGAAFGIEMADAVFASELCASRSSVVVTATSTGCETATVFVAESGGDHIAHSIPCHVAAFGFIVTNAGLTSDIFRASWRVFVLAAIRGTVGYLETIAVRFTTEFVVFSASLTRSAFDAFFVPGQFAAIGQRVAYAVFAVQVVAAAGFTGFGHAAGRGLFDAESGV